MSDGGREIKITGACSHNLQNVSLSIPRGKLVVVTGLSGSGKSTLAFDTLQAEGQRRYMDTLSTYAKHFMGIMEKPQVESITGLSPIIAIEQKTTGNNPRSTVGTITEVYDFLRLLFARASTAISPVTGKPMVRYTQEQIIDLIIRTYQGRKCYLLSPVVAGRKGSYKELFDTLRKRGYAEVRIDGQICSLSEVTALDRYKAHFIELVVDKLKPSSDGDLARLRSSVGTALDYGKGSLCILEGDEIRHYSRHLVCEDSGTSVAEPAPHTFSFNSPQGYCPLCKGLGTIVDVDMDKIIPDRNLSIAEGAIVPLGSERENKKFDIVRAIARKYGFSLHESVDSLPDEVISLLVYGSDELFRVGEGVSSQMTTWDGVMEDIEEKKLCPVCNGTRLRKETQYFHMDGKTISEVSAMEIRQLYEWICSLDEKLDKRALAIGRDILKELRERVRFLLDVGLEYLSLDRPTSSLSGGEAQRIRLATQIGSHLVNVLYILDEPSIGLHPRDNTLLIDSLKKLRDMGNSVMVVEHDAQTMLAADHIVDIGPGAGTLGGRICYNGPLSEVGSHCHDSITLEYLTGLRKIEVPASRRKGNGLFLGLRGCTGNNLKNLDIDFPLGCMIGVSGVSGSGKSSLVTDTLMMALENALQRAKLHPLPFREIVGLENIDKVIEVDQSPIGRTPRSNPATFTDVFTDIRKLFENTPDAKIRGFKSGRFSFNVPGGRCEECKGAGLQVIQMNFLPSVNVTCPECRGRRYKEDTLCVRYKGKNINDVLEMTVSEACEFFGPIPSIAVRLKALQDVGLGYVRLGQSAVTLSGGESQRMKLASQLGRKGTGRTLYILDEPTTGLHFEDIRTLLSALNRLVDEGNTVIIIEHNLDILKSVDYIFDMGPQGGRAGGFVVAQGTPEEVARNPRSVTGAFIREALK